MWAKRLWLKNRGETTRGETTRGETSWGRNVLLSLPRYPINVVVTCGIPILNLITIIEMPEQAPPACILIKIKNRGKCSSI